MRRWEKLMIGLSFAVTVALLVVMQEAWAYTGTANATSAALSDMRVNPSQAVTWTPGQVLDAGGNPVGASNSSLSFDGTDDYVSVADDASLDGDAISLEAWIYRAKADANEIIASRGTFGAETPWLLACAGGGQLYSLVVAAGGNVDTYWGVTPAVGTWYHVAFTYSSADGMRTYVDGVPTNTAAANGLINNAGSTDLLVSISVGINCWNGTVDEVRLYTRVLSPAEVAQHSQGIYIIETGLVLHLDLDGEALDQSGSGNDGTLHGGPAYADGWASVPVSTYFNGTLSVSSRRILVNSTDGDPLSTIPDTAPATWGNYTGLLAPDASIGNATAAPFLVDTITVDVYTVHPEVDAGFNTLLYAEAESLLDGHTLADGDTLTVEGVAFSWNEYTGRFETTDSEATPQTKTYDTLTTLAEATYGITTGTMNATATVTWVTPQIDVVQTYLATGDILGAVYTMATAQLGGLVFWTFIMTGISLAVYNYTGPEATLLAWILGWGTFSVVVHGEAVGVALILLALGGGLLIAKMLLDRRAS